MRNPDMNRNEVRGASWSASADNGKFLFEHISADISGKLISFEITESEFESLKDESVSADELIERYRKVDGVGYFSTKTNEGYRITFPSSAHNPSGISVLLSEEEFYQLQLKDDSFDAILSKAVAKTA